MKKIIKSAVLSSVVGSSLLAGITATKVDFSFDHLTADSSVWHKAETSEVTLYPQTTVKMNDKKANELNANNVGKKAKVTVLYNGEEVAFLLRWKDETLNVQQGYRTDSYGDGFAVQLPTNYSNPTELPYIGMGSEGREVVVHLQKAAPNTFEPNGHGNVELQVGRKNTIHFNENLKAFDNAVAKAGKVDYQRSFVSAGFRSMTEIKDGSSNFDMNMLYAMKPNCWKGILVRPVKDDYINLDGGAFPVAFAVWDGSKNNRDGMKLLSGWTSVDLPASGNEDLVKELNTPVAGDVANGKAQYEMNCAACHLTKDIQMSVPFMAPDLTNIGGYASAGYIRESIVNPNAVVVPGYNRNAHRNTPWYNLDENGKRVSTMPDFSWMDEKSLNDLVAFLQTLKEEK